MKNTTHVIISNRHIHLNREACDILFGKGYELTVKRPMAPPIFAANETVTLKGPKGEISGVRVLGPAELHPGGDPAGGQLCAGH